MVVLTPLEWFAGLTPAGLVFSAIAGRAGGNESVAAGFSALGVGSMIAALYLGWEVTVIPLYQYLQSHTQDLWLSQYNFPMDTYLTMWACIAFVIVSPLTVIAISIRRKVKSDLEGLSLEEKVELMRREEIGLENLKVPLSVKVADLRGAASNKPRSHNSPDVATDMLRWMSTGVYTPSLRD